MAGTAILGGYDAIRSAQEDFYRDLHAHPELSHHETRTAAEVVERLTKWGFQVHGGIGGTGVVGVLSGTGAGDGDPTVLLRADMDALPVREATGVDYASTVETTSDAGEVTPVMHACGHDIHVACLLGAAQLFSMTRDAWHGTLVVLFQPAEETGDGAQGMVNDGLLSQIPAPDVALGQHVLPGPSGHVGTRVGPVLSAADSMRVTVFGRGGHGSMPQNTIDPVVLAAMIVVRLQTVIAREVAPTEAAVLTVGSMHAGQKSNIIPDQATLELNMRTYTEATRAHLVDAVTRIVRAECAASACERDPEFEVFDSFPLTVNDQATTDKVAAAFGQHFGDRAVELDLQTASEDFSDVPRAAGIPYSYWGIGGTDPQAWAAAVAAGTVHSAIAANHSPLFLPVIQPTLQTGTEALIVAASAWLAASD
ncbi:M20 family metallopeptidase [Microbacterium kribbense]|uniref:M20 family metallopeptidase n=1 Tax=Microbacterium kribbense TaxID=433645 RepID=A0ABP7GXR3_9MICO